MQNNTVPIGLIVPVNVVAFCVGEQDAKGERPPVESFSGATTHYDDPEGISNAFLGANVSVPLTAAPYIPLEQGVHLHWALPDALTQGKNDQGSLQFPPVPNRWLISRFFTPDQATTPQIKSWVVASDALFLTAPQHQTCVTLPIASATSNFAYLGRQFPFAQWPPSDPGLSIKEVTKQELTAVSNGTVAFASYYPDCRSVFGLIDSLDQPDDPKVVSGAPIQLAYVITGWYENAKNDPLNGNLTKEQIEKEYQWTFAAEEGKNPTFTRYYSIVQGVSWDPTQAYIPSSSLEDIQATVTIGNSPAEVLSAHLRAHFHPDNALFEQLFHAFQKGQLFEFIQPKRQALRKLLTPLHQSSFSTKDGGMIYSILAQTAEEPQEVIDLPLYLAQSLNQLNLLEQTYDFYQKRERTFRSQLFSDWYHIFTIDDSLQNSAFLTTYHRYQTWSGFQSEGLKSKKARDDQLAVVQDQLASGLTLHKRPAPRYMQPNEPVIAIASHELRFPKRYGGDGQHRADNLLMCRLTDQVLTGIDVEGHSISLDQFASVVLPTPNPLPLLETFNALLQEACLLNIALVAHISHIPSTKLQPALEQFLAGESQPSYKSLGGQPPAPVMMTYWKGQNPWLPLFMEWSADFIPLHPTVSNQKLQNYSPDFFNNNYTIDPSQGGAIHYTPQGKPIDPQKAPSNNYQGQALLSQSSSSRLIKQLTAWNRDHPEVALAEALTKVQETPIMVQPLSGFNIALLMHRQSLQMAMHVSEGSHYQELTDAIAPIVGNLNKNNPELNSFFHPIRAGYLAASPSSSSSTAPQLKLSIVDVFGKKRKVSFDSLLCAESMITTIDKKVVPSTAYLPPRLSQPSRLLFHWIAADNSALSEMNSHPAASPVCGWLLPSHLGIPSLFLYNQQGQPLGTLYVKGPKESQEMAWQSSPGNEQTIDQEIEEALVDENLRLKEFALSLRKGPVSLFLGLLESMEINSACLSQSLGSKSSLATLVGAPVALVQTSLCLEIEGDPAIYQGIESYTPTDYKATDLGSTSVKFPVILGGIQGDGLIGYFKQKPSSDPSYDLSTFYTSASVKQPGVVNPSQDTLCLTPTPQFTSNQPAGIKKTLMLVDPRAQVHASMGILPTAHLQIPPDQCASALSQLEVFFLVAPTLITPSSKGPSRLALPTPNEPGFEWSWIQEEKDKTGSKWITLPSVETPARQAISAYTPQQLTEGWLRLNPVLVEFNLLNNAQRPQVTAGVANSLQLVITNKRPQSITFSSGQLTPEGGKTNKKPIFYLHFSSLVSQDDAKKIQLAAPHWSFACFDEAPYGVYWAAVWNDPKPLTLRYKESITIQIKNLLVSSKASQAWVYFDYYNIQGSNDGIYKDSLSIQQNKNRENAKIISGSGYEHMLAAL